MSNAQHYYTTSYPNCNNFTTPNLYLNNYNKNSKINEDFTIIVIIVNFIYRDKIWIVGVFIQIIY